MRTTCVFLLAALFTVPGFAQQKTTTRHSGLAKAAPASPDTPSKEQLIRLFDAMELRKQMSGMVSAMSNNLEKMMPSNMGDLSEKQKAGMAGLNAEMFGKVMSPEFVDSYVAEMIPIYQQHFTKTEVDDLISFYASPVGQKFLREQPGLTQESLTRIIPLVQKRVQETMEEMNYEQRIKQIFADQEDQPAPAKK